MASAPPHGPGRAKEATTTLAVAPTLAIEPARNNIAAHETRDWRLLAIFVTLSLTSFVSALNQGLLVPVMPSIVYAFGGTYDYVWVLASYNLAQASVRPAVGALSDTMGRRKLILASIALFAGGSAISGSSISMSMLIAGMAMQGLGGCGITMLCQIIICDLVALRFRSKYCGLIYGAATVGYSAGPVVGGLLAERAGWRWCYFATLPPCIIAAALLAVFLQVNHVPHGTREVFKRMDWRGNIIFTVSCVSTILALSWAGTVHPWVSLEVLLPLLLGVAGFAGFLVYEAFAPFPVVPLRMFRDRNFIAIWTLAFANGIVSTMLSYYMVYLQGVLASTPAKAGVQYLPAVFATTLSAIGAGQLLAKSGDFKLIHIVSAALQSAGSGLMSTLDARSPTAMWVVFRMISGIGPGALGATVLPAAQAALPSSDIARSAAALAVAQSLGSFWGLAIPAAIFNGRAQQLSYRIHDATVRRQISNGQAYSHATASFLSSLSRQSEIRDQVIGVFADSLRLVWYTMLGISAACFICLLERKVPLQTENTSTEFGLRRNPSQSEAGSPRLNSTSDV